MRNSEFHTDGIISDDFITTQHVATDVGIYPFSGAYPAEDNRCIYFTCDEACGRNQFVLSRHRIR